MKLTTVLLLISVISAFAGKTYSQTKDLNLNMTNSSIKEVLLNIEEQSEFYFMYSEKLIDVNRKVSLNIKNQKINEVLDDLFAKTNVEYTVKDRFILLTIPEVSGSEITVQQQRTVSGTVTDDNGQPLPGVTVVVKGTAQGTVTNTDGEYSIPNIPGNATLQFSFVGMRTQEVVVGSQTTINVEMVVDAIGIDEVVAIGYGSQKRANVTGSVSSVKSDELTVAPSTNVASSMIGRTSGIIARQESGQPGSDTPDFNIRGFGNPLVIVDGTQRNFTQLDPNEVESINILKDASAAVYGARAGNGVILVTTKRGTKSEPEISFNSSMSYSRNTFYPENVNAYQFAEMVTLAEGTESSTHLFSQEEIDKYRNGTEPGYVSTDWVGKVMRDWGPQQQHNVNVRGGSQNVLYFFSLGYLDQESIWKSGDGTYQRYNITSNIDVNISKRLSAKLDISFRREDRENPRILWRIFRGFRYANPTIDAANWPFPDLIQASSIGRPTEENPVGESTQDISGFIQDKRDIGNIAFSMDYDLPIKGLSIDGKFAFRGSYRNEKEFTKAYEVHSYDYENEILKSEGFAWGGDHSIHKQYYQNQNTTTQIALRYDRTFNEHNIKGLLLNERINNWNENFWAARTGVVSSDLPYLFAGASEGQTNNDNVSEDGRESWVGRANYSYNGKYLAEFTFRYDGSPRFPKDTRWGFFPGVSLGWRISDEAFMQNNNVINNLKLRASASRTGYDAISVYDYLTGYEFVGTDYPVYNSEMRNLYYLLGDEILQQLRTIGLPNSSITWEKIDLYNIGIDGTFFNNSLSVLAEVFYRKRSDILASRLATVPNTFGADLPLENINSMNNRGFETELIYRKNIGNFSYNIGGNFTIVRARWDHFEEREFDDEDDRRINQRTGQLVNRTFGYRTNGFFNSQEEIDNELIDQDQAGNATLEPGDIRYVDYNGDGVITERDQVVIGKGTTPEIMYGLNIEAIYKGFDFNMLLQGAGDFAARFSDDEIGGLQQLEVVPLTYQYEYQWRADNPEKAKLPAPNVAGVKAHNSKINDMYVKSATYLRLRSLSIGYSLPKSLLQNTGIERVRIYASGTNLLTFSDLGVFENYDPEIVGGGISTYPIQKVLSLGINVTL